MRYEFEKPDKASGQDILNAFMNARKVGEKVSGTYTMKLKVDGADKVLSELTELNNAVEEYQNLAKSKGNTTGMAKYFGSQEKMINNVRESWSKYVNDFVNGKVDIKNLGQSNTAKSVLRNVNALQAIAGVNAKNQAIANGLDPNVESDLKQINDIVASAQDKIMDSISVDPKVVNSIKEMVSMMRNIPSFSEGNYNLDIQHFENVFSLLQKIKDTAKASNVEDGSIENIFKSLGLDNINTIKNQVNDLSDTIDQYIDSLIRLRQAETAGGGSSTPTDDMRDDANESQNAADKKQDAVKKYIKATEEEMEMRLKNQNRDKNDISYYDFYGLEDIDNRTPKKIAEELDSLISLRDSKLSRITDLNNQLAEGITTSTRKNWKGEIVTTDHKQALDESIKKYYEYQDKIEFLQKELQQSALEFKPGDSWGTDEISTLITLLQMLVSQVNTLSQAFGSISDDNGISPLLTQFADLGTAISHVALELTNLKSALSGLDVNLNINAGGNNAMIQQTLVTNARRDALEVFSNYRNELIKKMTDDKGLFTGYSGQPDMVLRDFDLNDQINNTSSISGRLHLTQKLVDLLKEAANIQGIDISDVVGKFEPQAEGATSAIQNLINTEEDAQKSADKIREMFGTKSVQLPISADQIIEITDKIQELQKTISDGLGVKYTDDKFDTSFLDQMINKTQEVGDSIGELSRTLNTGLGISELEDGSITTYFQKLINIIDEFTQSIGQSFQQLKQESSSFDAIGDSAQSASISKEKFAEANKHVADTADETTQYNEKESESFNHVNEQALENDKLYNKQLENDAQDYDRLINKKAETTNLEPEEQSKLDKIIERRKVLNGLIEAGMELSQQERDFLDKTDASDKNATKRRELLDEQLRISQEESQLEEERSRGRTQTEQENQRLAAERQKALEQELLYLDQREDAYQKERDMALSRGRADADAQAERPKQIKKAYDEILSTFDELSKAKSQMNELEAKAETNPEIKNTNEWAEATDRLAEASVRASTARKTLLAMKDDLTPEQYQQGVDAAKKAPFGSGKSQDKKRKAELDNIKSIADEYYKAQSEMNELKAKVITGELDVNSEEYEKAAERLQKAYDQALEAKQKLDKLKDSISKEKYNELLNELDKGDIGSSASIGKIDKAYESQYKQQVKLIQDAIKAKSELNNLYAQKLSGKQVENETDAMDKYTESVENAKQAIETIRTMNVSGIIDDDTLEAAENLFKQIQVGDDKSRNRVSNAYKNKEYNEVKSQIQEYQKLHDEYLKLQQKSLSGDMVDDSRMEAILNRMVEIETNWNKEKANGLNLDAKQLKIANQIASQQEKIQQNGESDTKKIIDGEAEKNVVDKEYNRVKNKIQKMYDTSDWRTSDWVPRVDELMEKLKNVDLDKPFGDVLSDIQKIEQEIQQTSKSIDFQPARENWVSSTKSNLQKWMNQNKIAAKEYKEELDNIIEDIDKVESKGDAAKITDRINNIQGEAAEKHLTGKSLGDRFKDQFKNTMTSLATYYLSFQDFIRYGRAAIETVTDLDTQLTEMRKVSNESLESLQNYQLETFDIADRVGTTASQIQSSTADWLRLGKNLPEASQMAELSTKLLNVSEFTDIKDATDALVSATQAYTEVQAPDIVDKLNLIGNNYAVSTDELAQGLQNAGAVLKTQGNDIDQTLALLTAGNLIGQDMSKASAGIRTIALRISGKLMPKHIEIYERVIAR